MERVCRLYNEIMKDFLGHYKYKLSYALSLLLAIFIIYGSVQSLFKGSMDASSPNVILHVLAFIAVIVLVLLALYFRYKDSDGR